MVWGPGTSEVIMINGITPIISPKSVAVVGATDRPGSVGQALFDNILKNGFRGIVYPVNPRVKSVSSVRTYPSLLDIPDEVDMAVIIVPARLVSGVVGEAARKGVKGITVITAGFKEVGQEGADLERKLREQVLESGIRMIGPNCLGVINTHPDVCLNASFTARMPRTGGIGFISQSGALCAAVLEYAHGRNIGFSKFISFGNKADVSEVDLLEHLRDDPETQVILMYLEDISDGPRFIKVCREITWVAKKPILAVKSGRSVEGARAAASHTGSLAGSDLSYDAIFMQSGITRVEYINELFHYAIGFAGQQAPRGDRIAIVTNAGGPGIMATDTAVRHGLKLATLSGSTIDALKRSLPPTAALNNPVDVIGDATTARYEAALRAIIDDENVDGVIAILTPTAMTNVLETAEMVTRVASSTDKPVLCSFMGIVDVSEGVRYLENNRIPNYTFPEAAVRTMKAMADFSAQLRLPRCEVRRVAADKDAAAQIIVRRLDGKERHFMPEHEANEILGVYGFPVLKSRLARDVSDLESIVEDVGFPVAMKIASPDVVHKFDAGGVVLKIKSLAEAQEAYDRILGSVRRFNPDARIQGVLVEKMARKGVEVILGAMRDPLFGPLCMFGLGGTFVETVKDVTFRLAPMWEISAERMIETIRSYRVLKGVRGNPPSDIDAIKDCILRLSQLVSDHPEIAELDINPLIVYPEGSGCVVADSRILLTAKQAPCATSPAPARRAS